MGAFVLVYLGIAVRHCDLTQLDTYINVLIQDLGFKSIVLAPDELNDRENPI